MTLESTTNMENTCAYSMRLSANYVALGCPSYLNNMGEVKLLVRTNYSLSELVIIDGDGINYQIGEDLDLFELSSDHVTLFYT
jgi:hypothetical protein